MDKWLIGAGARARAVRTVLVALAVLVAAMAPDARLRDAAHRLVGLLVAPLPSGQ